MVMVIPSCNGFVLHHRFKITGILVWGSIPGRDNFFNLLFSFNAGRIWQEILNYAKNSIKHSVPSIKNLESLLDLLNLHSCALI